MFTLNPGHNFVSADCNKEKACIMNHLSGSVPLSRERLQQHKRKTSVRKGRHVRWASVAALEFFFCRDHMTRKTIMLAPKSEQHALLCLNKGKMPLKHFSEDKSACRVTQTRIHPSDVGCGKRTSSRQTA